MCRSEIFVYFEIPKHLITASYQPKKQAAKTKRN